MMSQMSHERTFKKIGKSVEAAFARIDQGLDIIEMMEEAEDEMERERYAALATLHLHHSWHSMMRLFKRVARDFDEDVPKGSKAMGAIVEQMFQRTSDRPSVLSMQHQATVRKLLEFYRTFRNVPDSHYSRREVAEMIDSLGDEIIPSVLESARIMALATPGGQNLIAHLHPVKAGPGTVRSDLKKTA